MYHGNGLFSLHNLAIDTSPLLVKLFISSPTACVEYQWVSVISWHGKYVSVLFTGLFSSSWYYEKSVDKIQGKISILKKVFLSQREILVSGLFLAHFLSFFDLLFQPRIVIFYINIFTILQIFLGNNLHSQNFIRWISTKDISSLWIFTCWCRRAICTCVFKRLSRNKIHNNWIAYASFTT